MVLLKKVDLYISVVVASEILAHVHFDRRDRMGYDPELFLTETLQRNFEIIDIDRNIAKTSGILRADHAHSNNLGKISLKTPDAIIGATSINQAHTLLITNDAQLAKALPSSSCIYLRELALEWLEQNFPLQCLGSSTPIQPNKTSQGLLNRVILPSELCAIAPDSTATYNCILADAYITASAFNEPCLFFLLINRVSGVIEIEKILSWHKGLGQMRPIFRYIKYLKEFLEYKKQRGGTLTTTRDKEIHVFYFTSLNRETIRQQQTNFASKSSLQKKADTWHNYLSRVAK